MNHDPEGANALDQIRSRYRLLRQLGSDGPFPVYAVRARDSNRHFVLKVIDQSGPRRTRTGALQLWQAHTVKALDHPKLIEIHAVHHLQGGAIAVAMERRRGRTLAELMESGDVLPLARIEHILSDVAEALEYLHARGAVHRGVRPESILLDFDRGHARLAPFGVDREADGHGDEHASAMVRQFTYLAPEQIAGLEQVDGRRLSPRSDLYSLGLVGWAMLAGRPPWRGENVEDLLRARKRESLNALQELRPDLPGPLLAAISHCLEPNRRRRCGTAREFIALLESAEASSPRLPASPSHSIRRQIERELRQVPAALAATMAQPTARKAGVVTAVVVMGLLAFSALRATEEPATHPGADVPFQTATVIELPAEQSTIEPTHDPEGAEIADVGETEPETDPVPDLVDAAPLSQPSADLKASAARSHPFSPPRRDVASAERIVLLGEPLSRTRSSAPLSGGASEPGDAPR